MAINGQFIYVAEHCDKSTIREIDLQLETAKIIAGNYSDDGTKDGPALSSNINRAFSVTLDKFGNLYISDQYSHRFRFLNMTSMQMSTFAGFDMTPGYLNGHVSIVQFIFPRGLAIDSKDNVYTIDGSARVRKIAYE